MTRYVISDLHLDHENIIEYCDRPFDTVAEMNEHIIDSWNEVVDETDSVLFLGDFAWWGVENIISFYDRLNGEMLLIRGNHDEFDAGEVPFPVVESCTVSHRGIEFYCEHYPVDVPEDAPWWSLHGHIHNNSPTEHPFILADEHQANVSCELLGYEPISLDELVDYVSEGLTVETLSDARAE